MGQQDIAPLARDVIYYYNIYLCNKKGERFLEQ